MSENVDTKYSFIKNVNSDQISREILVFCAQMNTEEGGDIALSRVETIEDNVDIWFNQVLSVNAESQLNDLVANYVFVANYVAPEEQAQINKLIGYLNNDSPTVANTARSVIVLNIAPRLGSDLISIINAQIAIKLGF